MNKNQKSKMLEYGLCGLSAFLITFSLYPYVGQGWSLFIGIMIGAFANTKFAIMLAISVLAWVALITTFGLMITVISMIVILALLYTLLPI